jgi:hypothetical protein
MNAQWTVPPAALLVLLLTVVATARPSQRQRGSSDRRRGRHKPSAYLRGLPVLLVAGLVACTPNGRPPARRKSASLPGANRPCKPGSKRRRTCVPW